MRRELWQALGAPLGPGPEQGGQRLQKSFTPYPCLWKTLIPRLISATMGGVCVWETEEWRENRREVCLSSGEVAATQTSEAGLSTLVGRR